MRQIPRSAGRQFGVFTVKQALASGWDLGALKYWTSAGGLVRLRRGAYALAASDLSGHELDRLRLIQQSIAAVLLIPAATISHGSAVALYDLPLLEIPARPCITLEPPRQTRPAALHVHRQHIPAHHMDTIAGFRTTSVARSCIDLAREQGLVAGVAAADAAIYRGLCSAADLEAVYSESCRGRAGLANGRKLLKSLDGNTPSALESVSRLALEGPVKPQRQVLILSPQGQFIAHAAFYWEWLGLVGEVEDNIDYTARELRQKQIRHEALADHGLVTECWGWDVALRPEILRTRVQQAIHQAAKVRAQGLRVTAVVRPERLVSANFSFSGRTRR